MDTPESKFDSSCGFLTVLNRLSDDTQKVIISMGHTGTGGGGTPDLIGEFAQLPLETVRESLAELIETGLIQRGDSDNTDIGNPKFIPNKEGGSRYFLRGKRRKQLFDYLEMEDPRQTLRAEREKYNR